MESKPPECNEGWLILEHRLVMEKFLGRPLRPEEEIHHIDGNRENNKIENLILFKKKAEHVSFERKQRKTISTIMKNVLIDNGCDSVMYGDCGLLDERAARAKHTTLMDQHPLKRHDRIFKALDNSGLFIKSKIGIPLLDGRINFPVRCFTLIQEFPE